MKPKISVIVPCYQVEQYLVACLNSVCQQSFSDYEVICVEDCSKDNTMALLQGYQAQHPDLIKVVAHAHNQGVGVARNTGMAHAQGEYLTFVDSDDLLAPDALANLYDAAQQFDADVVIGGMVNFRGHQGVRYDNLPVMPHTGLIKARADQVPLQLSYPSAWARLYKTSFYLQQVGEFATLRFAEEVHSAFKYWWKADKIVQIKADVYFYRNNASSLMNVTGYQLRLECMLASYHAIYTQLKAESAEHAKALFLHYISGLGLRHGQALHLFFKQNPEFELEDLFAYPKFFTTKLLSEIFVLPNMTYKLDKGLKRQLKKALCQTARLLYRINVKHLKRQHTRRHIQFQA